MRFLTPQARKHQRDEKHSFIQVRAIFVLSLLSLSALGLLAAPVPTGKPSNYPSWWFARGVIAQNDTNNTPSWPPDYPNSDDYAVINQGQLKNFATQAYAELQSDLPAYARSTTYWTNLSTVVNGWNPTNGDAYVAVNLGQLKTVSASFYNVLVNVGYTNNYPWTGSGADDYAVANIGQAKNAFSFDTSLDTNGLPYWWELKYFGYTGLDPTSSPAANGLNLLQDYQQGNNPTNYYSQGGTTITPTLTVAGGNSQIESTRTFEPQALSVSVTDSSNHPLVNAPVIFAVTAPSDGQFAASLGGPGSATLQVVTDATGTAQVYYAGSTTPNLTSSVLATTGGSSATFSEQTHQNDAAVAAPSGIMITPGTTSGQMILNWTNNATNATYIVVQQSSDNINWTTIASIDPSLTTYTVNESDPNSAYYFGVIAGKP